MQTSCLSCNSLAVVLSPHKIAQNDKKHVESLFFIVVPAVQLCDIVRQSCCVVHCKHCKTTAQNPEIFCHREVGWLVGFVALRPKSTAMVIAGRSVHLTTLFPGQA